MVLREGGPILVATSHGEQRRLERPQPVHWMARVTKEGRTTPAHHKPHNEAARDLLLWCRIQYNVMK